MLREQVAGYYDVKTKTVNLLNWVDAEQQKPVLAHELTHALQDQSFGIEKWMKGSDDGEKKEGRSQSRDIENDEESSARQAVIEGQAMVVLLDYSLAPTGKTLLNSPQVVDAIKQGMLVGTAETPAFRGAPIFLKEELTFPYRYGLDFTAALLQAGGKGLAYAGAFNHPPKTTREIMEPQTYLAHEKLEPLKMIDMDRDFKATTLSISARWESSTSTCWSSNMPAATRRMLCIQNGAAVITMPEGRRITSRRRSPCSMFRAGRVRRKRRSSRRCMRSRWPQRYQKRQPLAADGKVAEDAPPAESWGTLRGRHAWLTEEGVVLIEVRGDAVMVSESLDDESTRRAEADFWPPEKAASSGKP
jgi:hypothetical protein